MRITMTRTSFGPLVFTVLVSLGLTAGCGRAAPAAATGSAEGPVVVVAGTDAMRFTPDTIHVKAGETVTLTFRNDGVLLHDLVTRGATRNAQLTNVAGGRQKSASFLAAAPGTYQVLCTQPGHTEAGMFARIVVSG